MYSGEGVAKNNVLIFEFFKENKPKVYSHHQQREREVQTGRGREGEGNKALEGREERRRKGRKEIEKREEGRSGKEGRK